MITKEDIVKKYNIDSSKLTRDYIKYPLDTSKHKFERPCKKDLEYLYLTLNLPVDALITYFGIGETTIATTLKEYTLYKTEAQRAENIMRTALAHYGVPNVSYVKEIRKKANETNKKRYGEYNVSKAAIIKERKRKTNLAHWGEIAIYRTKWNKLALELMDNPEKLKEYLEENKIESAKQLSIAWNLGQTTMNRYIRKYKLKHLFRKKKSMAEEELQKFIAEHYEIVCNTRKVVAPLELDIYIPSLHTGIEYNGIYWHSIKDAKLRDRRKKYKAKKINLNLIIIKEKDWLKDKEKVKTDLLNKLTQIKEKQYKEE